MGKPKWMTDERIAQFVSFRPEKGTQDDDQVSSTQSAPQEPGYGWCVDDVEALVTRGLEHEVSEWLLRHVAAPVTAVVH